MLPKNVREAEERANAIHAQVYGNTAAPAPAPDEGDGVAVDASAPAPAPAPVADAPAPAPAPVAQPDPWEEKYRVLDGKYRAEVPRMAQEIRELKDAIQTLRESAPAPAPAPVEPTEIEGMSPEQVVEQFGEDFAKAVGAVAERIAKQNTDKLRKEFAPKLDKVEKSTNESVRSGFMRELQASVPDWQAIDRDDGFTAFLDEVDSLSGRSRRFFFNEADQNNDAARVAQFFLTFKGNSTAPAPAPAPAAPSPAIDALLQPSTSRASDPPPPGKRTWTQADIRQFYVDVRKGRFTPAETKRIESDIFAAQRENRLAA